MATCEVTAFGVNFSPFIPNALKYHLEECHQRATPPTVKGVIELLKRSFYVNDCVSSAEERQEVANIKQHSAALLRKANMNLRKWRSNAFEMDEAVSEKVLGLGWDVASDELYVSPANIELHVSAGQSRQVLLQRVASLYDPLGLVCPVTITGKVLLQEAWREGGSWDDPLSKALARRVEVWWAEIQQISSICFERWVSGRYCEKVSLHLFTDASETAYGCCIYIVSGGQSRLLYAKACVASLIQQTLARLEPQAAYLGSSCLDGLWNSLRVATEEVNARTDSLTAWHWLQRPAHIWSTWIASRVASIQDVQRRLAVTWRHCPGKVNPADLTSRGAAVNVLRDSKSLWRAGPDWIGKRAADDGLANNRVMMTPTEIVRVTEKWHSHYPSPRRMGTSILASQNGGSEYLSGKKAGGSD